MRLTGSVKYFILAANPYKILLGSSFILVIDSESVVQLASFDSCGRHYLFSAEGVRGKVD